MKIPAEHMQNAVDNWVNFGCPAPYEMGAFFRALLVHDLMASAMFADDVNRPRLADWAQYLYNDLPGPSHGSEEKIAKWHAHRGLHGLHLAAEEVA